MILRRWIERVILLAISPLLLHVKLAPQGAKRELRFQLCSECLGMVPFQVGILARRLFYERTLRSCGANLVTRLGVVFVYPDASVGSNVFLNRDVSVGLVDIGDDVMASHRVSLLSGRHQHGTDDASVPIRTQQGKIERIRIGTGVWIGADATIMGDVGDGSVVGAGSVVVQVQPSFSVIVGNPARVVRRRMCDESQKHGAGTLPDANDD